MEKNEPTPNARAVAHLKSIRGLIPRAMLREKARSGSVLQSLESRQRGRPVTDALLRDLAALESRLAASARRCDTRYRSRPRVGYPRELPIAARAGEIVAAIRSTRHRVVIISGETGCGKSTQIPKMCLEAGRGIAGLIGCTQPRRLAAVTIAYRIAEELGEDLGRSVGYKIRFQDRTSPDAYIKIMTDGILLAETQGDRRLSDYDTIIIDEAHERSLNIDFLLGILRKLVDARPDLKLIITSATLDTAKFSAAFRNAPVIEVSGRLYPVDVEYRAPDRDEAEDKDYVDQAVEAVTSIRREKPPGDILVFMPTEQDILETCRILEGRKFPVTTILPLFSRLPAGQQRMVYSVTGPKIVVATNVAETSLTIPGIRYVVDTGVARIAHYQPGTRINSLPISPISRASADQRKGRCGRVREGLCVRLYSQTDYESRDEFTAPEILRSDLAEVILRMIDLDLGEPLEFPFIDRPASKTVRDGYETLVELGAVRRVAVSEPPGRREMAGRRRAEDQQTQVAARGPTWVLTDKGRRMARMQLDPRISRMLLEAEHENCLSEVAVLAAALSIRDPRERPPEQAAQADAAHAGFGHPNSDFLVLLNIWNRYHSEFERLAGAAQKRRFCHEHFLSFPRMREWVYLHEEIAGALAQLRRGQVYFLPILAKSRPGPLLSAPHADISPVLYAGIHRAILAGFLSNIAVHKEKNMYAAAKNREVMLWPGSVLFNKTAGWIVATEIVKTSRLYARSAAKIDPAWLEDLGGPLCKRSYSDAAWDRARGEVTAKERVTLFGLEIVRDRRVSYGRINPIEAHEIFVMTGLTAGDIEDAPPFLRHNLALQLKVEAMEEKLRHRDIMVAETAIAKFYSDRIPGIFDIRTLAKLIKDRGGDDWLRLSEDDLLARRPAADDVAAFPDSVEVAGRPFKAVYRFAPGQEDDGVTLQVPASILSVIPPERLEWGVPGQYKDKIAALIKGLPKRYRKLLVPVADKAETIATEMPRAPEEVPLFKAVAEFVKRRFGADIPPREWAVADVPKYLRMRVAVTDRAGRVIDAGRDVDLLKRKIGAEDRAPSKVESPAWKEARARWERTGITAWDFGDLPEKLTVGTSLTGYPALVVEKAAGGSEAGGEPARAENQEGAKPEHSNILRGTGLAPSSAKKRSKPLTFDELKKMKTGRTGKPSTDQATGPAEQVRGLESGESEAVAIRLFPAHAEAEASHRAGVRALLMRKFGKELEFVKRYHRVPAEFEGSALFFGGRPAIESAIEQALAREAFERNIRTESEYNAYEAEIGRTLFEKGHALTQTVLKILDLHARLGTELAKGKKGTAAVAGRAVGASSGGASAKAKTLSLYELSRLKEPVIPPYIESLDRNLERLVPKNFLAIYRVDEVLKLPRYLEAMKIRLERARIDPEKDKTKEAQLEPYTFALERLEEDVGIARDGELAADMTPSEKTRKGQVYFSPKLAESRPGPILSSAAPAVPPEKRQAVSELRWMVEEFKVSLFAPEVKTAFPISAVRLARKIKDIDAIV